MSFQQSFTISTHGRGTTDITESVQAVIQQSAVEQGLAHIFIHHTSASLMLCENADPAVLSDLESFMSRLAPDGDPMFRHTAEGPDDMPAHIRSVLTQTGLSIPVKGGSCDLGTWQGIYLWEHRTQAHQRRITVTLTA
jgi:secondary thiamine-phosphate synthase enzyme